MNIVKENKNILIEKEIVDMMNVSWVNTIATNQVVTRVGSKTFFYSYDTLIAIYENENCTLYLKDSMWDYSNTTRKYFKQFIEEYTTKEYGTKQKFLKEISENEKIVYIRDIQGQMVI